MADNMGVGSASGQTCKPRKSYGIQAALEGSLTSGLTPYLTLSIRV